MNLSFFLVDAFTDQPFKGNTAGVCLVDAQLTDLQMQQIARQVNASETAFVTINATEGYNLRWFTPLVEINLCGHATLGSAHVLWQEKKVAEVESIVFSTKSGIIPVEKKGEWIEMSFPIFESRPSTAPAELLDILDINPIETSEVFDRYLFEVATEAEVKEMNPDFGKLKNFKKVLITSKADEGSEFDFISRYFAPSIGVNEDPVTGTSHSCLAPYWSKKLNKKEFLAYQASKRGGILKLMLTDEQVKISGKAHTTVKGIFTI